MENSYLVFTKDTEEIQIERFHICTWEFNNGGPLVEFGCELKADSLVNTNSIIVSFYIPWLNEKCKIEDFYERLRDSANSRFIFNDSISETVYINSNNNKVGIVHKFTGKNELSIMPVKHILKSNGLLKIELNLVEYHKYVQQKGDKGPNIYFRYCITPGVPFISTHKGGISKSTILYDVKVNERRNIPDSMEKEISRSQLCPIDSCFCFHIVPNDYSLVFFDSSCLKSVRMLEYESFKKYLGQKKIKRDDLMVVFNKKLKSDSFTFFSIYSKERVGTGLIALALVTNIICGILLYIPSFRATLAKDSTFENALQNLPIEIYIAFVILILMIIILFQPTLLRFFRMAKIFHKKINKS